MNIYIGNLDYKVNESELVQKFEEFGEVSSVNLITDKFSDRSKGFAFVTMDNQAEAEKAINELNGKLWLSREIVVNEARQSK